jgi:hypothetical protein
MVLSRTNLSRGMGFPIHYDNCDYSVQLLTYRWLEGYANVLFKDITHGNDYMVNGGYIELNGHRFVFKYADDFRPERLNYIPMTNQLIVQIDE